MSAISLCVVAGEPSGDLHGGLLVDALRQRHPDWEFWGVGGERMAGAGCRLWQDARDWSVMGFAEVLRSLPRFHRRLRDLSAEVRRRRPSGVILIDFPGFNLKLARRVHAAGIPTLYYIVPQVWAWAQSRVAIFRRHVDRTVVIFPFEREFFAARGVTVDWVGHPFVDSVRATASREELRSRLNLKPDEPFVAILPGSRVQDFDFHLPLFAESLRLVGEEVGGVRWALGLASALADSARDLTRRHGSFPVTSSIYDLMAAADVVLTKTGTATVECALIGTPMICVYRTGAINFAIARRMVKVPFIAMPNLIAERRVVPELIQSQATPQAIAAELVRLLRSPLAAQVQRDALAGVRERLGPPGAVSRAADVVEQWVGARP